jgi:hypothetical protein
MKQLASAGKRWFFALKGQNISAQGNALGIMATPNLKALKGRDNSVTLTMAN